MSKRLLFLYFIIVSVCVSAQDNTAVNYSELITTKYLSKHLNVIASDKYEGRETGKKGQKMAAKYISEQFAAAGIPPYKNNSYYQEFPVTEILPNPAEFSVDGKKYQSLIDFYNYAFENPQKVDAPSICFIGYGIQEPTYDDYKDVIVKDKVLMMLSGEPVVKDSISLVTGNKTRSVWSSHYKMKTKKARELGAKAVLIIVDNIAEEVMENKHRLESARMELDATKTEMPVLFISKQVAKDILRKDMSLEELQQKIISNQKPFSIETQTGTSIIIKSNVKKLTSENVLAYIEGSDLKNELIVVTAHYDHLGMEGKTIYNGADDDGSGTVAIMAMAQAFAKAKKEGKGPRRSILFMAVSGEEKGLLGSSYYVEHPEFPIENTVCDLNIDMIGRVDEKHKKNPNYVYLIGSDKLSSQLHQVSESVNKNCCKLELDYTFNDDKDRNRFYYRSDHYNFAKKGIPVIFYFNGTHEDYHRETDDVKKINFEKIEKITRYVFFTAWELANREERIVVDSKKDTGDRR